MKERDFQIAFERQLNIIIASYNISIKLSSDTIFYYINRAKDQFVKQIYGTFQANQSFTDKLRTLVTTKEYNAVDLTKDGNKCIADYPEDYLFALGEEAYINIIKNNCPNLIVRSGDVIEATIETIDTILQNSLSEYHLHHNQAKPVRLYTDNKIILYTDGNYYIDKYKLTYLKSAKDLGNSLNEEYTDIPEHTHQEIIDSAVNMYVQQSVTIQSKEQSKE